MKRKHIVKVIIVFVLMFMSTYGQNSEALLNTYSNLLGVPVSSLPEAGISYSTITQQSFIASVISLLLSSFVMMIVPLIYRIIKKNRIEYTSGKRLCLWNSIVLFVLQHVTGIQIVGGLGAILYYFINKWLFVDD